jgi:hypothetical protein
MKLMKDYGKSRLIKISINLLWTTFPYASDQSNRTIIMACLVLRELETVISK